MIGRSKLPTLNDFPDFSSRRITSVNSFRINERIVELPTSNPNDPINYNDLHLKGLYGRPYVNRCKYVPTIASSPTMSNLISYRFRTLKFIYSEKVVTHLKKKLTGITYKTDQILTYDPQMIIWFLVI